jgi:hypothetical protein
MGAPDLIIPGTASGTAPVGGTGTTNYIPRWNPGPSTLGDSVIVQSGSVGLEAITISRASATNNALFVLSTPSGTAQQLFMRGGTSVEYFDFFRSNATGALHVQGNQTGFNNICLAPTSGNVGIGTASPNAILSVYNASTPTISLWNSSNFTRFSTNTNDCFIDVGLGGTAGALIFRRSSSATESARIDSTGNFSLGVIPSAWASSVRAEEMRTHARWNYNSGSDSVAYWTVNAFLNSAGNPIYKATAAASQYTQIGGAHVWERAVSGTAGNTVTWLESARIDSSGNLILNTANTGATIQAAGSQQGLKLPATPGNTDPNTLDCYADGGTVNSGGVTWTPALRFGGATTGITGSQVGRYTRIGNMVFAQGTIALSSKGSATGAASIAGLPTSANVAATIYYSIAIGYNSKVTFTGQLHGLISVNSGIVELYQTSTAGVVSAITNTDFAADSVLTFTVCYPVT